ncbi:RHS repeat-associated core domain-containing protein [Desulfovibrio sp. UCD-KL4C]|uniref:RHS repeat-associated core domain-containing protein n=1 Tax=Desulfovibrio sp. UCD-KL4C TaxID=2578120 RepID=UPI0025C5E155|nr:RHS repeat-associated core domain-containing protein [Desulfovibrio sp. UCD-KL4C]
MRGFILLEHREYNPAIGRFITPDPIGFAGGDVDIYGYCLDDPINFYDRTGLEGKSKKNKQNNSKKENKDSVTSNAKQYLDKKSTNSHTDNKNSRIDKIKDITGIKKGEEIAIEELKKRGRGNHNNEGDAMRHAEWSRRMTEELGSTRAWAFGVAHEIDGLINNQPWSEAMMDIKNNAEGRAAANEERPVDHSKLQKSPKKGLTINPYN